MVEPDFPTELPGEPEGGAGALRWTCGLLAITAIALALFNADAIAAWTEDLSPGPGTARIVTAAEAWQAATARLGLGAPHTSLHHVWKRAESMHWPGEGTVEPRKADATDWKPRSPAN
jgi:hypothetical protein